MMADMHVMSAIAVSAARPGRRHRPRAWAKRGANLDARCASFLAALELITDMTDTLCVEWHVARAARVRVFEPRSLRARTRESEVLTNFPFSGYTVGILRPGGGVCSMLGVTLGV